MTEYWQIVSEISRLTTELSKAEGRLVRFQKACDHSDFSSSDWWKEGYKHYERLNICGLCGKKWHEPRYDD